ncbi:MAG: hypothetical protein CL920_32745 [Deltaproteobacteria bacterium]|nr:hypothetical protein [Deltaproteobacteria bacterium]MBU53490.1 hypothetical protein [Deltaproteobacteria bacterium]|tara:strand:+ start:14233 stop:14868 length:636 start_codon:yes stop_codon:yes gene_type:complete
MSGFFDSETITMPGLSMRDIESIGEDLLQEVEPSALTEPTQLDVLDWSDHKLQTIGFHVVPVRRSELELHNCREGMADHRGRPGDPIELLIEDEFFSELIEGGRLANRARAIIIHELSHGILHVPLLRQYQYDLEEAFPLKRAPLREIKTFQQPEWQAWALTGAIMVPRCTLLQFPPNTPRSQIASFYGVSEKLLSHHIRRLRLEARYSCP